MKQSGTNGQLTERETKRILRQMEIEKGSILMEPIREAEAPPFKVKPFKRLVLGLCGTQREVTEGELARYLVEAEFNPPIGKSQDEAVPYIKSHCGTHYRYEEKTIQWRQSGDNPARYIVTVGNTRKK